MAAKPSIIALQVVRGNENIYLLLRYPVLKPGISPRCDVRLTHGMLLPVPFFNDASIMFVKLLRSVAIGLIVGAIRWPSCLFAQN